MIVEGGVGSAANFRCAECGYQVNHMVHGYDRGMAAQVHAISCTDCHELRIARIGGGWDPELPWLEEPIDLSQVTLRCPVSAEHRVSPWTHPGPCPRCGTTLVEGDDLIMWD